MIVYKPSTPRAAPGVAAVAMAAVTMAVMVILPAELEAANAPQYVQADATRPPVVDARFWGSANLAKSLDSDDDGPPGIAALEMPAPRVHPGASNTDPRNRT